MDKASIVELANMIRPPSAEAWQSYHKEKNNLMLQMNETLKAREDINDLIGSNENISMMEDNHHNHVKFMDTLIKNYNGEILVDTVCWVLNAYISHGFKETYWSAQLSSWCKILNEKLDKKSYDEIVPIYEFLISYWPQMKIVNNATKQ